MVGDVSGKGVPAALYMAKVVSVFKTFVNEQNTARILTKVNRKLVEESGSNLFVTLTCMVFTPGEKISEFAVGGHLPTIVLGPDGDVELLDVSEGLPLGIIESDFAERKINYKPGSVFILYTDGVTEAVNTKEEMFGQDRLVELVRGLKDCSAGQIVDAVHKAVADFAGRAKQHDDITVMAIRT